MKILIAMSLNLIFIIAGFADSPNGISNPKIKWKFKTQGTIRSSAVVSNDRIYFGSADAYLYALNKKDGSLRWKFETQGAIAGSPAVLPETIIVSSRDNFVYALNSETGELIWKFEMQSVLPAYTEWEYFTAAPVVSNDKILVGSGDGHIYALSKHDGKLIWKFQTAGRIRATPLVDHNRIYQPSNDGFVYALSEQDGKFLWRFRTEGASHDKSFGFDRTCIFTKPSIVNDLLVFGSRDGNTYAVDVNTHKQKWKFSYGPTWAMSTSVADETVFVGWSTNKLICALDLKTGKEKWKFEAGSVTYTTGTVHADRVFFGSADGNLYCLNKETGKKEWQYTTGREIFSSALYDDNTIYFGCDDGYLYALEEGNTQVFTAVYQPVRNSNAYPVIEPKIGSYLKDKGFKVLDSAQLYDFVTERIKDQAPSVIVFNYDMIPPDIMGENPAEGMIRKYLAGGGKIIWFGGIPNRFSFTSKGKNTGKHDISIATRLLEVNFISPEESGNYFSRPSQAGMNLGLPAWLKTTNAVVAPEGVTVLAYDEYNRVSAWQKKFHPRPSSGFISFRTWAWEVPIKDEDLELIHKLAMYGLE